MFRSWYATCPRGAEEALEAELQDLGAKGVRPGHGGVRFTGEREIALRGCLDLRTALRMLEPVADGKCSVSLDLAGDLLSNRGYRVRTVEAPLREALAAAVVLYSGWQGTTPLRDPLCGSGTLAIEAALFASKRAPNLRTAFATERWPRTAAEDGRILARLRSELVAREVTPPPIFASDRDTDAVEATRANARAAGVRVDVSQADARELLPLAPPGQLLLNVPYGERLEA